MKSSKKYPDVQSGINGYHATFHAGRMIIIFAIGGSVGSWFPLQGCSPERIEQIHKECQNGVIPRVEPSSFEDYLKGLNYTLKLVIPL
jgi:hypothetical protein